MSKRKAITVTAEPQALGGLDGANTNSRRLASWQASMASPDRIINSAKPVADARAGDLARNDGISANVVAIHRNSIVGSFYRLSATPNWRVLGATEAWSDEFQQIVEARFSLYAESEAHWADASRKGTLTDLIRLAVGGFVITGEVLSVGEWIRESDRPYRTAVQMTSPARLSNPRGSEDSVSLRRGVEIDRRGRPMAHHIRTSHPGDYGINFDLWDWKRVQTYLPWGRRQVLHIFEPLEPGQNRGISDMVAAMETMQMTRQFRGITLENAIVNATYAAAIESELPESVMVAAMGGGTGSSSWIDPVGQYLDALGGYLGEANNLRMDGVKIPHLFPGTKLNMKPAGTPGGVGTEFEASMLRHVAASLGVSYEELSKDFQKSSYSSGKLAGLSTERFMAARKKLVADGLANFVYGLWLEEEINRMDNVPPIPGLTRQQTRDRFYEPLMREAFSSATWIGASVGQTDEMKETQAAIMRIKAGLSTWEIECARLGKDWREVFDQQQREKAAQSERGLDFAMDATAQGKGDRQATLRDNAGDDN